MNINKAVELMKLLDEFYINQVDDDRYIIGVKEYDDDFRPVICIIDGERIDYCLDDLYNNGCAYEPIDFEQLNKLQRFVKIMQGGIK